MTDLLRTVKRVKSFCQLDLLNPIIGRSPLHCQNLSEDEMTDRTNVKLLMGGPHSSAWDYRY